MSTCLGLRVDGTPDPDWFILIVRPEQVTSVMDLIAAVTAVKPAGLMWTLIQTDGTTWAGLTGTWASWTGTWDSA